MIILPRPPWSHKGDFGRVLIIGGSARSTGAPCLAGMAALRSGADTVTIIGHERAMNTASAHCPDLITIALKGELEEYLIPDILEESLHADAVLIGSGLSSFSFPAIRNLVSKIEVPMVLDAAAIHAIGSELFEFDEKTLLLTPHAGEFKSLTNDILSQNMKERENQVKYWANQLGVTLLTKGHIDIISDGVRTANNINGNPFMTVNGTGDILAGVTVALLAQKMDPFNAANKAAQKVGQAGDTVAEEKGAALMASDLLSFL